ncbi:type II secretion system protein [Salinirubrum litoreum]|uniref:Type II secretion system protein n=1 Tax=Salinirubrum litoreum TaxID=1126234 RepID=A0ABD5RAL4_9EURY|nr:type II secretion system protein [Salinirubrum litoreum]
MVRLAVALSACCPASLVPPDTLPAPSGDLRRALSFLGVSVTPHGVPSLDAETVVRAGFGAGLLAGLLGFPVALFCSLLVPALRLAALPAVPAVALGTAHTVHRLPVWLARVRRTRALGRVTGLFGRAVLRMRIEPSPERSAVFAGRTGTGPLADSLAAHARRARGTPRSGFAGFAEEWRDWLPAVRRATALVDAAGDAPPGERARTLDRALSAVLDGTHDRLTAFAGEIRGPATGLYAFGVLLPLALLGVLPAARVAGVGVGLVHLVLLYDVVLPVGLLAVSAWLLTRRPVAFPPPRVGRDHPDVPTDARRTLVAVVGGGVLAGGVTGVVVAEWAVPVAVLGAGIGAGCLVRFRPIKQVRDHARAVESGLDDALYLVGRRVLEGESVETALTRVGSELSDETGEVVADASRRSRVLDLGVRQAFVGDLGALRDVPSQRARGTAELLALAASEGRPAGEAVVALADHLGDLRRVETDARQELRQVTGTLASTAALFGPLVAGATVALADGMAGAGRSTTTALTGAGASAGGAGTAAGTLATADLGVAVGVYTLLLTVVLTALSVGLEHGLDRALVGYRVGIALLSATATFLASVLGAGLLV